MFEVIKNIFLNYENLELAKSLLDVELFLRKCIKENVL